MGQYSYEYDEAGRLTGVEQNGVSVSHNEYDANGSRTAAQIGGMKYARTYSGMW